MNENIKSRAIGEIDALIESLNELAIDIKWNGFDVESEAYSNAASAAYDLFEVDGLLDLVRGEPDPDRALLDEADYRYEESRTENI